MRSTPSYREDRVRTDNDGPVHPGFERGKLLSFFFRLCVFVVRRLCKLRMRFSFRWMASDEGN